MNIRAGIGEYILQTYNTHFFEDSMGGFEPPNPRAPMGTPVGYAFQMSFAKLNISSRTVRHFCTIWMHH